uniref:ARID domain-containing protein n=2 Tax=Kalanchoe fedtschenkoi TaxID=63787 RepID=A0A7N0U624_KALFE
MEACQNVSRRDRRKAIGRHEKDVVEMRGLFDQINLILCRDLIGGAGGDGVVEAFPPVLSDGRVVDLFELYEAVRARGGCARVCKKGWWHCVAAELDLSDCFKRSLRPIYMKYLDELDRRVHEANKTEVAKGADKNPDLLSSNVVEAESKVDAFGVVRRRKEGGVAQVESEGGDSELDSMIKEFARKLSRLRKKKLPQGGGQKNQKKKKNSRDNDEKSVKSKTVCASTEPGHRKRKRESVHGLLKWVTRVAKNPMKYAAEVHNRSKGYYAESLSARQALSVKRTDGSKEKSPSQKKMRFYYDDETSLVSKSPGILRSSKRVSSMAKSFSEGGTDKPADPENLSYLRLARGIELEVENLKASSKPDHPMEEAVKTVSSSAPDKTDACWIDNIEVERRISVGQDHQAEVPEWTGVVTESDSKWLGTRMWPPEKGVRDALVEIETPDSCRCQVPGSVTCARLHVAEKRLALKRELGSVFYEWKFDQMGEEVSLKWTDGEEFRFAQLARRNPTPEGRCFWDFTSRFLRRKTRRMLISYYFNVHVLRRRSYQNRVTPTEIDSDDDDSEFGLLGGVFGEEATSVLDSITAGAGAAAV